MSTPFADGIRPWTRIEHAALVTSQQVLAPGELVIDDAGMIYLPDGATPLSSLAPLNPQADLGDAAWTAATLLNGWIAPTTSFAAVGFRKDGFERVQMRGVAQAPSDTTTPALQLPESYRPGAGGRYLAIASSAVMVEIHASGEVYVSANSGDQVFFDGVSFIAEN